ncbi:gap junction beta-2 protein-like [Suncus etruscus]|uniref:gap junction beta-2 protein-like n=1 Tax=Suncus etruscus TaxID=109475 RepID=UPI00210F4DAF|nr:gap junction beta-2 protein-like [Suncus etruscus]
MAESNLEGVGPTLVQMSEEPTSIYVGRKVWFGLLFAYFAAIYVVQGDWFNLEETFKCFGNISTFCLSECGNQQFSFPVVGVWYAFGFLFSSTFALMEFWVAQKLHKLHKQRIIEATNQASDQTASTGNEDTDLEFVLDTSLWAAYIVYFVLQTTFQVIFLFILVHFQLPLLQGPIQCSTQACPGPYSCAILDRQEKWASIIEMILVAMITALFNASFLVYTICMYRVSRGYWIKKRL